MRQLLQSSSHIFPMLGKSTRIHSGSQHSAVVGPIRRSERGGQQIKNGSLALKKREPTAPAGTPRHDSNKNGSRLPTLAGFETATPKARVHTHARFNKGPTLSAGAGQSPFCTTRGIHCSRSTSTRHHSLASAKCAYIDFYPSSQACFTPEATEKSHKRWIIRPAPSKLVEPSCIGPEVDRADERGLERSRRGAPNAIVRVAGLPGTRRRTGSPPYTTYIDDCNVVHMYVCISSAH